MLFRSRGHRLQRPPKFESMFLQAKQAHFEGERATLQRDAASDNIDSPGAERRSMKRTSKLSAINRLSALWTVRSPRLALSGVLITEEMLQRFGFSGIPSNERGLYVVSKPEDMTTVISSEWAKVFSEQPFDNDAAEEMLGEYSAIKHWDWSLSSPPNRESIVQYLQHLHHCEPGTDGTIPFAWKLSGEIDRKSTCLNSSHSSVSRMPSSA